MTALKPEQKKAAEVASAFNLSIRQVEARIESPDIISRLKQTWFGRLYKEKLKKFFVIQKLVVWLILKPHWFYRNHIAIYLKREQDKRWSGLIKLQDFVRENNIQAIRVLDGARVATPAPKVFPTKDQDFLVKPHDYYDFPPIYVAPLNDAIIYGGTNLVFVNDQVIAHDLYDFERDYTSEELHGRHAINVKKHKLRLLRSDNMAERISTGASFIDACAPNYAHWLTEVLPRIAAFCSLKQFSDVPIIVNEGLHKNIMESLMLVVDSGRAVITVPIGRAMHVDTLYVTSACGYTPFEHRNIKGKGVSHGLFSPLAIEMMKSHVPSTPDADYPKKIYLRRTSQARQITNIDALEKIIFQNGYVAVEPEKLSFLQQVALFRNAEHIIGAGGAAFSNMIFASPNVSVTILIGRHSHICYWYWQNIACASNKQVNYVLSPIHVLSHDLHFDFQINPIHLIECLQEMQTSSSC